MTSSADLPGAPPPPAGDIVWIASYPKSGNTWVRFLACTLLFGRQDSAAGLNVLAPDVHELGRVPADHPHRGLMKTHFAFGETLPLVARTAAAIYVVRHPADVIVSNFYYAQRSRGAAPDSLADFDAYVDTFLTTGGDPRLASLGLGTWAGNVTSWLDRRHPFPVACLRYEDLSADPIAVATGLASFLRPHSTAEEIRTAVELSSFARMREVEEADIRAERVGIFYKPYLKGSIDSGLRFMRSGRSGEGIEMLNGAQRARLTAAFGSLLRDLGYRSD